MQQTRSHHLARFSILLALIVTAATSFMVGCTMVGDRINGVQIQAGPTSCIQDCNDRYNTLYDDEQKLHQANIESCQALTQPERDECLAAEGVRHEAAKDALSQGKVDCQNDCHRQGAGSAG